MFPDITWPKSISGGNVRRPLHRTPYSSDNAANRAAAVEACKKSAVGLTTMRRKARAVTSSPFAATWEGAVFARPRHNFSVYLVPTEENSAHGTVLGAWFSNNRIISLWRESDGGYADSFYVKLD